jgi:hypothetical protein
MCSAKNEGLITTVFFRLFARMFSYQNYSSDFDYMYGIIDTGYKNATL